MQSLTNIERQMERPAFVLNVISLICPQSICGTRMQVSEIAEGQALEVLADDPAAYDGMKSWIRMSKSVLVLLEKQGNTFEFLIRKVK